MSNSNLDEECRLKQFNVPKEDFTVFIARYNAYRDYVKHEDTLLNFRITWLLTAQAGLSATVGLMLFKSQKICIPVIPSPEFFAIAPFILLGLTFAVNGFGLIHSAQEAIRNLENEWSCYIRRFNYHDEMPFIVRGGAKWKALYRYSNNIVFALAFIVAWLCLASLIVAANVMGIATSSCAG